MKISKWVCFCFCSSPQRHLDSLATVGVPIWATELSVDVDDENTRADYYERALRVLYGHPAVEGIMLWGFWSSDPSSGTIVSGDDMQVRRCCERLVILHAITSVHWQQA